MAVAAGAVVVVVSVAVAAAAGAGEGDGNGDRGDGDGRKARLPPRVILGGSKLLAPGDVYRELVVGGAEGGKRSGRTKTAEGR